MEHENLLNYAQAAELLNLKRGTIYSLVSRRQIPFIRLGTRIVRFSRSQILAWLQQRAIAPSENGGVK
jgi:excisionase family DNA binding protein